MAVFLLYSIYRGFRLIIGLYIKIFITGMLVSSVMWGSFADNFGRSLLLKFSAVFLFCFGLASAIAPNFKWFVLFRLLVGVFVGSLPQVNIL